MSLNKSELNEIAAANHNYESFGRTVADLIVRSAAESGGSEVEIKGEILHGGGNKCLFRVCLDTPLGRVCICL